MDFTSARLARTASTAALAAALLLCGCAHQAPPPPPPATAQLFDGSLFPAAAAVAVPSAEQVFALNDAMRQYAAAALYPRRAEPDLRRTLLDALYTRSQLRLVYDAARTRNAAEAFEARAGNCLSLVIMTAAFARHLGLPVRFRQVLVDELYTRSADLTLASGHVNLVLEGRAGVGSLPRGADDDLLVDFLPAADLRHQRSLPLAEATVVAMYFNNRAAEALTSGDADAAYAFARAAVRADPRFGAAANTLAVVYLRSGHLAAAEQALRHALQLEPDGIGALGNLALVLQRAGRPAEAAVVTARLAQLQPFAPFHFYELGRQAMDRGDAEAAAGLFARELRRQPFQHEVHFWAAQAQWQLGNRGRAADHLRLAWENSVTTAGQQLYAAKLAHLRAQAAGPRQRVQ